MKSGHRIGWIVAAITTLVLILAATPFGQRAVTTYQVAGLWHVDGSVKNWQFGYDGSLTEDGIFTVKGRWKFASDGKMLIDHGLGNWVSYRYRIKGNRLDLFGDTISWGLTRKD